MALRVNSEAEGTPPRPEREFQARSRKRRSGSFAPSGSIFKRSPVENPAAALPPSVFAVDKPAGPTSHDVVDVVRGILGGTKAGHAGTLDPQATGVLVLCLGAATKISSFLVEGEKEYEGTARLGVVTETQDATGKTIEEREVLCDADAIREAARRFVGAIEQVPPMYSAVKIGGQKLYKLARRGVTIDRPPRPVTVYSLVIESVELPTFTFRVRCSKGTYVRSIVHDLGARLGCGGHLQSLRRTLQGPFGLANAISWEVLTGENGAKAIAESSLSPEDALEFLPSAPLEFPRLSLRVGALLRGTFSMGGASSSLVRVTQSGNRLAAVAKLEPDGLRILYVAPASGRGPRREAP